MKLLFTQELINGLIPDVKKYEIFDAVQRGLFIRVFKNGSKIYYFKKGGKEISLGSSELMQLEEIRILLVRKFNIRNIAEKDSSNNLTIGSFCKDEFYKFLQTLKPRTQVDYTKYLKTDILPKFGQRSFESVTISEVMAFHQTYKNRLYVGNPVLAVFSKIYSLAFDLEYTNANNPCKRVKKFKEESRTRYLAKEEIIKLKDFLSSDTQFNKMKGQSVLKNKIHSLLVEFILLSGCRASEALTLKKANVSKNRLKWEDTKTGLKELPLTTRLYEIIKEANTYNNTTLVFAKYKQCSQVSLSKYWIKLRKELGFKDVRLHDLRHTFASYAIQSGHSLEHVRDILGHKNVSTTQRYTHLSQDDLGSAMDDVAKSMGF